MEHEDVGRRAARCPDGSPSNPLPGGRSRRCPSHRAGHTSTRRLQSGRRRVDLFWVLDYYRKRRRVIQPPRRSDHATDVRMHFPADNAPRTACVISRRYFGAWQVSRHPAAAHWRSAPVRCREWRLRKRTRELGLTATTPHDSLIHWRDTDERETRFATAIAPNRSRLLAAVTAALTLPFVRLCHASSQAPDTTETGSERLAHRRAAIRSNGAAAFSTTAFTGRQGVGTL